MLAINNIIDPVEARKQKPVLARNVVTQQEYVRHTLKAVHFQVIYAYLGRPYIGLYNICLLQWGLEFQTRFGFDSLTEAIQLSINTSNHTFDLFIQINFYSHE